MCDWFVDPQKDCLHNFKPQLFGDWFVDPQKDFLSDFKLQLFGDWFVVLRKTVCSDFKFQRIDGNVAKMRESLSLHDLDILM